MDVLGYIQPIGKEGKGVKIESSSPYRRRNISDLYLRYKPPHVENENSDFV